MYYVNLRNVQEEALQITHQMVANILIIPKQERTFKDHETIYKFFYHHEFFTNIERTKSLNARLKAISEVEITDKNVDEEEYKIVLRLKIQRKEDKKIYYDNYWIIILLSAIDKIKNEDEKYLRKRMEELSKFSLFKQMKYEQLLHIAYYMEEHSFKYKEYVFKENQQSQYLYLVLKGQFQYTKSIEDGNDQLTSIASSKKKKYSFQEVSPNKIKLNKSKEYKMGIVEGGVGQVMGEEELLMKQNRKTSLQCLSTENKVIRIHKNYYLNVMKGNNTKMNWFISENKKKSSFKKQALEKIIQTKRNYQKYISALESNQSRELSKSEHSMLNQKSFQSITEEKEEDEDEFSLKKSFKSVQANRKLIKNLSKNRINHEPKKTIDLGDIALQKQKSKPNSRYHIPSSEDEIIPNIETSPLKPVKQKFIQNVNMTEGSKVDPFLPQIHAAKQTVHAKVMKSWSASRPNIELKKMKSKYYGMIDSNALVKEKEYILSKKMPSHTRDNLFPLESSKRKDAMISKFEKVKARKQEAREMRSAVHSKDYMQSLLIDALRKAGYQKKVPSSVNRTIELGRVEKGKKKRSNKSMLEDNPFDQYYFGKI